MALTYIFLEPFAKRFILLMLWRSLNQCLCCSNLLAGEANSALGYKQLGIRSLSVKMEGSLLPSTVFVQITLWETDKLACAVS